MICDDILYLLKPVALISITSPKLKDRKHTELDKNHKPSHIMRDLTCIYFIKYFETFDGYKNATLAKA